MRRMRRAVVASIGVGLLASTVLAAPASARPRPAIAALQVGLRSRGVYAGAIDGVSDRDTVAAVRRFQRRVGLADTGVVNRRTRLALGRLGRPLAGGRSVGVGSFGWDVSVLEFELARHGFQPGSIDGRFDQQTLQAARRFRRFAGLPEHCLVEPATLRTLRRTELPRVEQALSWPVRGRLVGHFGVRGARLHPGVDIAAPYGRGVAAAGDGRVVWADRVKGGLGLVVRVAHRNGLESVYGHLSRIDVKLGQRLVRGGWIGLVGNTGRASRPRLYFEVRVRGAAVDPLSALH
jgi:murein DD-endopeptidase MepM/ murein hydrolase activator NlpD